jgi:hypothetical protein
MNNTVLKSVASLALFFSCGIQSFAQTDSGGIVVHKDPRVDMLVSKQIEINEFTVRNGRRSGPGFRILVVSSNDRNKVMTAKTRIYHEFPELKAYTLYQAPFFRLKVGNFKERSEAETYLRPIQKIFKSGVYIVPDVIEVKPGEL